jgi:ABC-type nickel/cobalt efflux system permease component RcnA
MLELSDATLTILLGTTGTVAVAHTLLGIDHSLPFIVLGRARRWTLRRTLAVTVGCGAGHVASSVVIGAAGALLGATLAPLEAFDATRGELAAALLIGFGLSYATWALWRLQRRATHSHLHAHADGTVHDHPHNHRGEHLHPHTDGVGKVTPWALFVIFLLGPCEPLIPLMVVPAMDQSWFALGAVVVVFGALTVATMAATVAFGYYGLRLVPAGRLLRFADVGAGLVVAASGTAVLVLGI